MSTPSRGITTGFGHVGLQVSDVERSRRAYEHFIATHEPYLEILHPDFVLDMSNFEGWPEAKTYNGVEGLQSFVLPRRISP